MDNTFTLQVADSETPTPMTAATTAGQLSITIKNLLNGNYAFEFSGFNASGAVVVAGSFTADGVATITGGVEDVNSIGGTPKNQTFTGTFTLTSDNRGQLVFASLAGTPTYDFAIDSTGAHARIIEFDSTGVRGSGQLELQNTTTCGSNTLSGGGPLGANFVIGVSGATASVAGFTPGPMAMVGRFTAEVPANNTTPGNIDTGEVDIQYPQNNVIDSSIFSGTFQTTNQSARCLMTLTQSVSTMNFSVYPVTSSAGLVTEAFVVETDPLECDCAVRDRGENGGAGRVSVYDAEQFAVRAERGRTLWKRDTDRSERVSAIRGCGAVESHLGRRIYDAAVPKYRRHEHKLPGGWCYLGESEPRRSKWARRHQPGRFAVRLDRTGVLRIRAK